MATKAILESEVKRMGKLAHENKQKLLEREAELQRTRLGLTRAESEVKQLRLRELQALSAIGGFMAAHYSAAQLNASEAIETGKFSNQLSGIEAPNQFEANGLLLLHLAELLSSKPGPTIDGMRNY